VHGAIDMLILACEDQECHARGVEHALDSRSGL
jgi:hypothetical protein